MKELKKRLKSGESLVEALVGIFIFLIVLAALQSAITFCSNAQRKSEEIRSINTEICRSLRTGTYQTGANTETYEFKAIVLKPDGGIEGESNVLFKVDVNLGTMEAEYREDDGSIKKVLFYLFREVNPDP